MQSSARRKRALSDDRLDGILRALADRTRRRLLARLASGPAMVSELAEPFAMSRVAISKHLRVLEQARLVARTIDGRVHECSLTAGPILELEHWLKEYRSFWTDKLEALSRYAEKDDKRRR